MSSLVNQASSAIILLCPISSAKRLPATGAALPPSSSVRRLYNRMDYQCATCGKDHLDLPDIAFEKPDPWFAIPENERASRTELTSDTCIIDNEHYFIRAVLLIPLRDYSHQFGLGVWVSQKRENFLTYLDHYDSAEIGPFFGWLSTEIGYYKESTFLLKTMVHFRGGTSRPIVKIEPTQHRLSVAQREGITFDQALEIVHFYNKDRP